MYLPYYAQLLFFYTRDLFFIENPIAALINRIIRMDLNIEKFS